MQIRRHYGRNRLSALDVVLFVILTLLGLAIILPFYNAIASLLRDRAAIFPVAVYPVPEGSDAGGLPDAARNGQHPQQDTATR